MMENKRSTGVTVFGILDIVIGSGMLLMSFGFLLMSSLGLSAITYLISGIGVLSLQSWARKIIVYILLPVTVLFSLFIINLPGVTEEYNYMATPHNIKTLFIAFASVLCISNIFFFTRPKVKEQFK